MTMNLRDRLDNLRRRLEYWVRWPVVWLRHYYGRVLPEGHQICKCCGQADGWDFQAPNDVWAKVAGPEFVNRVLCLGCFWRRAEAVGIDPMLHITALHFREGWSFEHLQG